MEKKWKTNSNNTVSKNSCTGITEENSGKCDYI